MLLNEAPKYRPDHTILYAVPGWGKTSFAAQAEKPIFMMTRGETGLLTLMKYKQIKPTPYIDFGGPEVLNWNQCLATIRMMIEEAQPGSTFNIDTLNGLERLCHEHVCATHFGGDWGEKGFAGFQRGYAMAVSAWKELLDLLDQLRSKRGIATFALAHTNIQTIKNPLGPDYDQFQPNMHKLTWAVTSGWADMVLF